MKILMLCYNATYKGGTYWRALQLARGLAKSGHSITVMSTSRNGHWRFSNLSDRQAGVILAESPDLTRGPLRSGWDPYNTLARLVWGRNQHFDLVHAFEARPTVIYPALAWQRRGAKLILDWCDWFGKGGSVEERPNLLIRTLLRPIETYFEEHFRTRADGTTVINSLLRERVMQLGVKSQTIFFLPNGSDVETLRPQPQVEARQKLGWPLDVPVVGYLGSLFRRDAVLMAQAFNQLKQQEPRARLLLAGCNIRVDQLVTAPQDVIQTGPLNHVQVNTHLAACDICWLPWCNSGANQGRFPFKLGDYMAVGKPVVATAVGDVVDLIQRGEFGVVCQDTPHDLAKSVAELLRDPHRCEALGQCGRDLAERELRWDQIADHLGKFYQSVLDNLCN